MHFLMRKKFQLTGIYISESCHKLKVLFHQSGLVNHSGPLCCNECHFSIDLVYFSREKYQVHEFTQPMKRNI